MKMKWLVPLLLLTAAWGQTSVKPLGGGQMAISCNAVTASTSNNPGTAGGCTAYSLPAPNGQLPGAFTWQTLTTGGPAGVTVTLVGSIDGSTWTTLDTTTATSGEIRSVTGKPMRFIGCVPSTLSGGATPTLTCQLTVTTSSAGGGSGGGGSGTVTSITTTGPITGGPISVTGAIACPTCTTNAAPLTSGLPVIGAGSQAIGVGTKTGNTTLFPTFTGAATASKCIDTDASGNLQVTLADCGAATLPTSTAIGQVPTALVASSTTYTPELAPLVDVRWFFATPFPTNTQASAEDFGNVMSQAFLFAGSTGACVDISGLSSVPNLYATTNPYVGLGGGYGPCVKGGQVTIITGATWSTWNGPLMFDGMPSAASNNPGGFILSPCNTIGGCTSPGGLTVPQFPGWSQCVTVGGPNCYATGSPTSPALVTITGPGTVTCSGTTCTGVGTTFVSSGVLPGAFIISECGSNTCNIGSTSSYTSDRIITVTDNTHVQLETAWSGAGTSGRAYTIWNPNTPLLVCDVCNGSSRQTNGFGHVWRNIELDGNGVEGMILYYTPSCQEGCEYDNLRMNMQIKSTNPTGVGQVGACAMWDVTLRGASGGSPIGNGHYTSVLQNCTVGNNVSSIFNTSSPYTLTAASTTGSVTTYTGIFGPCANSGTLATGACIGSHVVVTGFIAGGGANNVASAIITGSSTTQITVATTTQTGAETHAGTATASGLPTDGLIFEAFDAIGGTARSGPNVFNLGTIVGTPANLIDDCAYIDGMMHGQFETTHCESARNDAVNVGKVHPSFGLEIHVPNGSNTITNNIVEFNSGSLGSSAYAAGRFRTNGCLVADDNLSTPCTATAVGGTNSTLIETVYFQSGSGGTSVTTGGGIVANGSVAAVSDGVHNGEVSLFGNTTNQTLGTGAFNLLGPTSLVTTPWGITFPAAENGSAGVLKIGAATGHISAATVGTVTATECPLCVLNNAANTATSAFTLDASAATTTPSVKFGAAIGTNLLLGTSTANLSAPLVLTNTNSTNNNTSITMGITAPGTSTGQTVLNVNGASTGADLADFGTGGTWTAGVLSGQTIVGSVLINGAYQAKGTTAGFAALTQGTTSVAVAPCNAANTACIQAPTAVTSYLDNVPGVAAAGTRFATNSSAVMTQGISGDANHSATVTIGSGTSIGPTPLCSTTFCPAGTYRVNVYVDITTACGTTGSYTINLIYTDDTTVSKTVPVNLEGTGSVPATGVLTTTSTTNFGYDAFVLRSTGAASINYSTTAVACGTAGPMVGKLYLSVEPLQ